MNRKKYEKNMFCLETKLIETKIGNDQFNVHVISAASVDSLLNNALPFFIEFCEEKKFVDGDRKIALYAIIFSTQSTMLLIKH